MIAASVPRGRRSGITAREAKMCPICKSRLITWIAVVIICMLGIAFVSSPEDEILGSPIGLHELE